MQRSRRSTSASCFWIASSGALRTPYADLQLLLSAVYVGVCAFRSLYPGVDLERVCLCDTWLSAILLGRPPSDAGLGGVARRSAWMTIYFSFGV